MIATLFPAPFLLQAAGGASSPLLPFLFQIAAIFGIFYFLMIRPQQKRMKEHRAMLDKLGNGDEVMTNGGIAGVVREIGDNFIALEVADGVRLRIQKGAIANVLPKGTLKDL